MARMNGTRRTDEIRPTIELVSSTSNPIGTLFAVWHNSRNTFEVDPYSIEKLYLTDHTTNEGFPGLAQYLEDTYPEFSKYKKDDEYFYKTVIREVVKLVIKCDVPASEFISYSFLVDNANVAWREQLVRARKLSIWMQTSRTADLREFDSTRMESVRLRGGQKAVDIYNNTVDMIRDAYKQLAELGVPTEDIRLVPQSMLHRVMFSANLRDLLKLIAKRNSWIAQSVLWLPITSGIIKVLRETLGSDIIDQFVGNCEDATYDDNKILTYKYENEVLDRYYGKDYQPCDPIWLAYKGVCMPENTDIEFYDYMKNMYLNIWNDKILKILGWDRNDPSKIGPYDRPYSWFKSNCNMSLSKVAYLKEKL